METEKGRVIKINGGEAAIRLETNSKCSHCGAKAICSVDGGEAREIVIPNTLFAEIGDQVEISYRESSRIFSAFLVFIVPLLFLFAGYVFGYVHSQSQGVGALWGTAGLFAGFLFLRIGNRVFGKEEAFVPVMVKVFSSQNFDEHNSEQQCEEKE